MPLFLLRSSSNRKVSLRWSLTVGRGTVTPHSAGCPTFGKGQAYEDGASLGKVRRLALVQTIQVIHSVTDDIH